MSKPACAIITPRVRCAIYVRKSTEENLNTDFNSLDAQREACESYVQSRKHEGWVVLPTGYSDAGCTGANIDRPALQRLIADIQRGRVEMVLVYKLDRLSRSLLDFAKLIEMFESHGVAFTAITQNFATDTAIGKSVTSGKAGGLKYVSRSKRHLFVTYEPPKAAMHGVYVHTIDLTVKGPMTDQTRSRHLWAIREMNIAQHSHSRCESG